MKFDEKIKDVMKAMKNAEIKVGYYVQDPKKNHASAIDAKIYVNKKDAEKAAAELGADVEAWPGLRGNGSGPYDIPKKYTLVK